MTPRQRRRRPDGAARHRGRHPRPAPGPGRAPARESAGAACAPAGRPQPARSRGADGTELDPPPQSFAEVIDLFDRRREALLRPHLWSHCHLVGFEPGRIEFRPAEGAPRDLANRLMQLLGEWTGTHWMVAVSKAEGAPTLATQEAQREGELRNEVAGHPLVRAVLDAFPGATIAAVRERFAAGDSEAEPADDIVADVEDGAGETEDET